LPAISSTTARRSTSNSARKEKNDDWGAEKKNDCGDDPFAIVHVVVGQYGFWRLVPSSAIEETRRDHFDTNFLYTVCSEDVYPPDVGWRAASVDVAPPPRVRPSVESMYDHLTNAYDEELNKDKRDESRTETRFFSIGLLVAIGGLLWTLVFLLIKVRLKPLGGGGVSGGGTTTNKHDHV